MTASQKSEIFNNSDKDLEKRVIDLEKKLDELIKLLEKKNWLNRVIVEKN